MRYLITIDRIETGELKEGSDVGRNQTVIQVYQQSFDELNVAEMITRLNHVAVKRPRKAKAAK